jgi:hypothetical protein
MNRLSSRPGLSRREVWQTLAVFSVATLLGLFGGALSATGRLELVAVFVGLTLAVLVLSSRIAVFWFVLVGALVVVGTLQLYLPGSRYVRYVIPLASGGLILHWVMDQLGSRSGQIRVPLPPLVLWAMAFALTGLISTLVNLSDPGVAVMGTKDYFQMWGFFLAIIFLRWKPSFVDTWPRALAGIALLQLPLAAHQYFVLVPKRIGMGGNIVAVDIVAGSFGAEFYGGGANAVLAAFLIIVIGCLLAMWKNGVLPAWKVSLLSILFFLPLLVNEAKISALYLPLVFLVVFWREAVRHPARFLLTGVSMGVVLTLLLTALTLAHPSGKLRNFSDLVRLVVTQQTAGIGERRGEYSELTRLTALTFWAKEHAGANPANLLVGHGLGSSRVQEGGLDIARTMAETRYRGVRIGYTTIAALLWDTGVIGLLCVLGMFVSAFRAAGRLGRYYEGRNNFRAGLYQGLQAAVAVLALSLAHKDFFVMNMPYQALTYLIIGWIAWAHMQALREQDWQPLPIRQ